MEQARRQESEPEINIDEILNSTNGQPTEEETTGQTSTEEPSAREGVAGNPEEQGRAETATENQSTTQGSQTSRSRTTGQLLNQSIKSFFDWLENLFTKRKRCPYCFNEVSRHTTRSIPNQLGRHIQSRVQAIPGVNQIEDTQIPYCATCGHDLPADYFTSNFKNIAVVGGVASGKSTYITVLIELLLTHKSLINDLSLHASIVNEEGKQLFQKYRAILLELQEQLSGTAESQHPILIRIDSTKGRKSKSLFISLFDTRGEEFRSVERILANHQHVFNADAILFLINSLDFRGIFELLQEEDKLGIYTNFRSNDDAYEIARNIHEVFVRRGRLKSNKKLKIPIVFGFTRADEIEDIADISLSEDYEEEFFDVTDIKSEVADSSESLTEFITEVDARILGNIKGNFNNFCLLPISPMGSRLIGNAFTTYTPKGVLNPILWILTELKFLR